MKSGLLIIDKPAGFTSFDVVAVARGVCRERKIGHTGTLDPMATGVLPLMLGKATKIEQFLPEHDKTYIAGFRLGLSTDTQDITGQVLTTCKVECDADKLEIALSGFQGDMLQLPPMYSAVQVNGRRLYELARAGETIERKPRTVTIHELKLLNYNSAIGEGSFSVSCSKGTYIRTICHDLGELLGCGGVMTSLRRTEACGFTLKQAISLDEMKALALEGQLEKRIIPIENALEHLRKINVTDGQSTRFCNGGALEIARLSPFCSELPDGVRLRVFDSQDAFMGIGEISHTNGILKVLRILS